MYAMSWKEYEKPWREIECDTEKDLYDYYVIWIDSDDIEVHFFHDNREYTPDWMK